MTVFWKALKHTESFTDIAEDLKRLRLRLNRNKAALASTVILPDEQLQQSVKVVYVNNCCQVRTTVNGLSPGAMIKLDTSSTG
jgi:hypothetical protein